jgi:hypothetical protein
VVRRETEEAPGVKDSDVLFRVEFTFTLSVRKADTDPFKKVTETRSYYVRPAHEKGQAYIQVPGQWRAKGLFAKTKGNGAAGCTIDKSSVIDFDKFSGKILDYSVVSSETIPSSTTYYYIVSLDIDVTQVDEGKKTQITSYGEGKLRVIEKGKVVKALRMVTFDATDAKALDLL